MHHRLDSRAGPFHTSALLLELGTTWAILNGPCETPRFDLASFCLWVGQSHRLPTWGWQTIFACFNGRHVVLPPSSTLLSFGSLTG